MRSLFYASLLLCGCSAIVDDSTQQCKVDTDCTALGLTGMTCEASGVCAMPTGSVQTPECSTNEECVTKRGAGFTCNASKACEKATQCSKHSECKNAFGNNVAAVCRPADGQCAPLFTNDCFEVLPPKANEADDMYLVGFMGIVRGDEKQYGLAQREGAEQALLDLQNGLGKLPGAEGQPRRNLAAVVCNHNPDEGDAATDHLLNTLKVPVVLGASYSSVTKALVAAAAPKGVLSFSGAATSPVLTTEDDGDLFFRTVPSDIVQTLALKQLVPLLTKKLRQEGVLAADASPTIVMPIKGETAGEGLYNGFTTGADAVTGTRISYEHGRLPDEPTVRMMIAAQIVEKKPHIILHGGTGEFIQYVVPLIEQMWTASYKPWYVVPEGDLEKLKESGDSEKLITSNGLAARLVGTSPGGRRSAPYTAFKNRFAGEPGNLAEFSYDAVYMLAYAIAATGKQYPTGVELAQGLRKTSCLTGEKIQGGTFDFTKGWSGARAGCINYYGPSGDVDFDRFGDTESDISVGCLQKSGDAYQFVRIDTYYSLMQRKLTPYKGTPLDFSDPSWCKGFTL